MPIHQDGHFETQNLSTTECHAKAFDFLKQHEGLTVFQIKQILQTASTMLEHLTYTDFSTDEFRQAQQAFTQSPEGS